MTIFSDRTDFAVVVDALRSFETSIGEDQRSMTVRLESGSATVNSLVFEPGGRFATVVMGMRNAVKQGREENEGDRRAVLDRLNRCDLILGLVSSELDQCQFDEVGSRLANATDGLTFDGLSVCGADGRRFVATDSSA